MPPIKCTPCRVTYQGQRYQIEADGTVRRVSTYENIYQTPEDVLRSQPVISESIAKVVRKEASRQRRNRNTRERNAAMRSLGMTKTPFGWE